jgi:hypothetical protein
MNPISRREFLGTSAAMLAATAASEGMGPRQAKATADSVIFINMIGGPSQLDTFDPKPNAPSDVRGPFRPISTTVPGMQISELFPEIAGIADKLALVRSVYHDGPPVHEAGLQLVNTGRLFRDGPDWPSAGAVASQFEDRSWLKLSPSELHCGIRTGVGQTEGWLKARQMDDPMLPEDPNDFFRVCDAAFWNLFDKSGFVTINQFGTVFDAPSWDCHADGGSLAIDLNDYRETVAPSFDLAFRYLIDCLDYSGRLGRTLVVATGEFGRTPKLNSNGGRDHWTSCWTTIFAGGGVKGGQVIGASDAIAAEPKDRPVHARDIPATVFHAVGIASDATIPGPAGTPVKVYEGKPITELF